MDDEILEGGTDDLQDIEILDSEPEIEEREKEEPATTPSQATVPTFTLDDVNRVVSEAMSKIQPRQDEDEDIEDRITKNAAAEAAKMAKASAMEIAAPGLRRDLLAQGKELLGEYANDETAIAELRGIIDNAPVDVLAMAAANPAEIANVAYSIVGRRAVQQRTLKPVGSSASPGVAANQSSGVRLSAQDRADYEDMMAKLAGLSDDRIKRRKNEFLRERGYAGAR